MDCPERQRDATNLHKGGNFNSLQFSDSEQSPYQLKLHRRKLITRKLKFSLRICSASAEATGAPPRWREMAHQDTGHRTQDARGMSGSVWPLNAPVNRRPGTVTTRFQASQQYHLKPGKHVPGGDFVPLGALARKRLSPRGIWAFPSSLFTRRKEKLRKWVTGSDKDGDTRMLSLLAGTSLG